MEIFVPEKAVIGLNKNHVISRLDTLLDQTYLLPKRFGPPLLLIQQLGSQVPAIAKPEHARLQMCADKRQQMLLRWIVWEWGQCEREDGKVGCAVYGVSKDRAPAFARSDEDKVVACGEREDTKDSVDGPR